jgi:hypothetical protein
VAVAKRAASPKVEPLVHQGVRYMAPNDDGRRAYIQAWDVQTNKKLWELTVFTNRIDSKLEEDVQHVFIKTLRVRGGMLIVTSERGKTYRVDLRTKTVTQSKRSNIAVAASMDPTLRTTTATKLFLNGDFKSSSDGKTIPQTNPATEQIFCEPASVIVFVKKAG